MWYVGWILFCSDDPHFSVKWGVRSSGKGRGVETSQRLEELGTFASQRLEELGTFVPKRQVMGKSVIVKLYVFA